MIRRNTWILLVLLVALVGFFFYLKNHKAQEASATPTPGTGAAAETPLFSASAGAPTDITVKDTTGNAVEIARNETGAWVLKAPKNAPADQGSAEAAASQVTALRVLSSVQLDPSLVGLQKPLYIMSFKFTDGSSHTLNVGDLTPIQDGYYTTLDGGSVKVVDKAGLDALIQLLKLPPFVATETPAVALTPPPPSETPTAVLTATPAPATDTPAATAPAPTATP